MTASQRCSRPGCSNRTTDPSGSCHHHRGKSVLGTVSPLPTEPPPVRSHSAPSRLPNGRAPNHLEWINSQLSHLPQKILESLLGDDPRNLVIGGNQDIVRIIFCDAFAKSIMTSESYSFDDRNTVTFKTDRASDETAYSCTDGLEDGVQVGDSWLDERDMECVMDEMVDLALFVHECNVNGIDPNIMKPSSTDGRSGASKWRASARRLAEAIDQCDGDVDAAVVLYDLGS